MSDQIIDAHQHFWEYTAERYPWINDQMAALKRSFLPEDLAKIYTENEVTGCVAVQADQSEEETDFLLRLAHQHDFIRAVVGWVDLRDKDVEQRLRYYKRFDKLKGFRHVVQDEADPNFLLGEAFRNGLRILEKLGYTYDLLVFPHQLKAAIQTVKDFPNLRFVLDHIAKPGIEATEIAGWDKDIGSLASEKNVMCKVSGMVTEASWTNWKHEDFIPYLDVIFTSFGPDRVMFGSDWPVCLLAGNYSEVLGIVKKYVENLSEADQQKLFFRNAVSFYGLAL